MWNSVALRCAGEFRYTSQQVDAHFESSMSDSADQSNSMCSPSAGSVVPVIDRNRCEAESQCVAVCPYHVFEVLPLRPEDRAGLSMIGRLKAWAHGGKQAYAVRADDCHACARCVAACPEQAIKLKSV